MNILCRKCPGFLIVVLVAGLCLSCGKSKGVGPDGGPLFKVELEHYTAGFDEATSQESIATEPCSKASNDSAVVGMDVPGEWIMVPVDIPEDGDYRPYLGYASPPGEVISVKLEMEACGTRTTANFLLTNGTGTG